MTTIENLSPYKHPDRKSSPKCFILHTTGETHLDKILEYYTGPSGIAPHYMIDYDGTIHKIVDPDRVAYHAGITQIQAAAYRAGFASWAGIYSGYVTWATRWSFGPSALTGTDSTPRTRNLASPLNLISGASPNRASIGIELRAPVHMHEDFTNEQYSSLIALLLDQGTKYLITLCRDTILGHYDVNPIARCNDNGDRDPGHIFDWDRVLNGVAISPDGSLRLLTAINRGGGIGGDLEPDPDYLTGQSV